MEYGLSLGSNLGDRRAHLVKARQRIAALPDTWIVAASAVYETVPVDVSPEFADIRFLNAVLVVDSGLGPERLSQAVHAIESALGRVRGGDRNAPRPIDVDILYADGMCRESEGLTLPHPRWAERRFVVQPLADVRPDLVLPPLETSVRQVLLALPDEPGVVRCAETREWRHEGVD